MNTRERLVGDGFQLRPARPVIDRRGLVAELLMYWPDVGRSNLLSAVDAVCEPALIDVVQARAEIAPAIERPPGVAEATVQLDCGMRTNAVEIVELSREDNTVAAERLVEWLHSGCAVE